MRTTRIGTPYFESDVAAVRYYKDYGFSASEVKDKVDGKEIYIGKPVITAGQTLILDRSEGRYFIETVEGSTAAPREVIPKVEKPTLDVALTARIWMPPDFGKGWDYENTIYFGTWHAWAGSYDRSESHNHAADALWEETKPEATQHDQIGGIAYAEYDIDKVGMDRQIDRLKARIEAIHERFPPRDPRPLEDDEIWYSLSYLENSEPEFKVIAKSVEHGVLRTEFKNGYMLNEPYKRHRNINPPRPENSYYGAFDRQWEDQGQYFKRGEHG